MKIKVLNKNNNTSYNVEEGSVFTENYNETLDSATVVINNIEFDNRINLEPYDVVDILDDNDTHIKYMCVDTYSETMICVNPKIYRYEISLFSETKLLEGVVLPNLKITKMPGITRSIYYYINQYLTEYCPEIRIPNGNTYSLIKKFIWTWTSEIGEHFKLSTKFNNECPEMQWNTPTLREVLNDLMMVNDCIVILKDNKIDYIDLTKSKKNISTSQSINYVTRSKSSDDYVSELQINLENVTNENNKNITTATRVEYVPFMTDETEVALKDANAYVKTKYPIYKLKSLKIMFPGKITYGGSGLDPVEQIRWMEYDLMTIPNFVTEYQQYITKPIIYMYQLGTTYILGDSQNLSIYYTRGTNRIDGFFRKTKQLLWMPSSLFDVLTREIAEQKLPSSEFWVQEGKQCEYYQAMFKVEYETLEGCVFRASKGDNPGNQKIVIDNQTNSMVDSYSQGFLEYQKANRLGNEQLQINARCSSNTDIEIGDIFEDTIVYQVQYQYFKNHVEVNAIATKNYILREYFTGVKSKIRSWVIASGSEALTRHDLEKYYCEFSWNYRKVNTDTVLLTFVQDQQYLFSPVTVYSAEPLKHVAIQNYSPRQLHIPDMFTAGLTIFETFYCLDLISRVVGNSLVFSFGFEDNYYVEKSIDTSIINLENMSISDSGIIDWADTIELGGEPLAQYSYTDDIGEITQCIMIFASGLKLIPYLLANDGGLYQDPEDGNVLNPADDDRRQFQFYSYLRPRIVYESLQQNVDQYNHWDYRQMRNVYNHHKDSQEILKISTQLEFCSETTNICVAKEWLKRQKAVSLLDNNVVLGLYGYNTTLNFRRPDEFPFNIDRAVNDTGVISGFSANPNGTYHLEIASPYVFNTSDEAINHIKDRKNFAWFLCVKSDDGGNTQYSDGQEPILLAFTNIPTGNIHSASNGTKYKFYFDIYLNVLKIRNKNIYDANNRYLIVDHI